MVSGVVGNVEVMVSGECFEALEVKKSKVGAA